MSHSFGLLVSMIAAAVGALVGALIMVTIDPATADILTKVALAGSCFLLVSGLATPALFWGKVSASNREVIYANFSIAVRQGILLALVVTTLLVLQAVRALSWWDAVLVIAGGFFIELALRSRS